MALPITLKTPGVYIDEKNAFPNSIVAVETAVPAFIGYTGKAEFGGQSLKNKPVRVESFMEFEQFFGSGYTTTYNLSIVQEPTEQPKNYDFKLNGIAYLLKEDTGTKFNLYDALKFFYQNGGGSCFIISVGTYDDTGEDKPFTSTTPFMDGIDLLKKETVPTMLLVPDAVLFGQNDCYSLQEHMLMHCGEEMNKVAILDIFDGDKGLDNPNYNPVDNFRNQVSSDSFNYGAAYYPWLNTTILQASEINYTNLNNEGIKTLLSICEAATSDLLPSKKAGISNYLNLLNSNPPTTAIRNAQDQIDKNSNSKVLVLGDLLTVRINAEYKLNDALSDTTPAKGTNEREAAKALALAKSNYDAFLKDTNNIPADVKESMTKITDAISGTDGLDSNLVAAKVDPEARKTELVKIYDTGSSAFKDPIKKELDTATTNLGDFITALKDAKITREGYYSFMSTDPKTFAETANYELADAKDALERSKIALAAAKDMPVDTTANQNKQKAALGLANTNIATNQTALEVAKDKIRIAKGSPDPSVINNALSIAIPEYKLVIENILKKKNLLPPAAAMAGIYTLVDSQRGVWKAPANVSVSSVVSPEVLIDYAQQEDLNAPLQGKAICAIRPFIGLGTMVWGARTLDANSLDWRYMNVRRTMIMLEQSIKFAAKAYVFEPNVKNTWVSIESMIENFLTNLWKLGALAGAAPTDAFSVTVGLGATMTANDILEGRMNIDVRVAISHPAEFIVITFQQQQQKS